MAYLVDPIQTNPPPPPELYGGAYKMCSEISKINIKYL